MLPSTQNEWPMIFLVWKLHAVHFAIVFSMTDSLCFSFSFKWSCFFSLFSDAVADAAISLECLCKHPEHKPRYFRYISNGGSEKKAAPLRYIEIENVDNDNDNSQDKARQKEPNVRLLHRCFDSFRFLFTHSFCLFVMSASARYRTHKSLDEQMNTDTSTFRTNVMQWNAAKNPEFSKQKLHYQCRIHI